MGITLALRAIHGALIRPGVPAGRSAAHAMRLLAPSMALAFAGRLRRSLRHPASAVTASRKRAASPTRDDRVGVTRAARTQARRGREQPKGTIRAPTRSSAEILREVSMRTFGLPLGIALASALLPSAPAHAAAPGLGAVLTTQDGGQIFGFDIDQNGDDGVLASAQDKTGGVLVSVETFAQNTGRITRSFKRELGNRNEYAVDGIFAGDVALITHYVTPTGTIYAQRFYDVMNPVTAQRFTGV